MLKRNWNWRNNRLFCHSFVIGEITIGGGPSAPLPLPMPMFQVRKIKKVFANFPRGFWRFPTKFQLFKKLCCPRAEDRAIFEDLRLRGQGLQNVSSRTSSRPRTSSRTPPLYFTSLLPIFSVQKVLSTLEIAFVHARSSCSELIWDKWYFK